MKTASCSSEMLEELLHLDPTPLTIIFASAACVTESLESAFKAPIFLAGLILQDIISKIWEVSFLVCLLPAGKAFKEWKLKHTWNIKGIRRRQNKIKKRVPIPSSPFSTSLYETKLSLEIVTQKDIFSHTGIFFLLKINTGEFPGGSVVRTLCSHCQGLGSVPGWGTKSHKLHGLA